MKRREILKYTALMTGAAVSTPLLTSILTGCTSRKESDNFIPRFFSSTEFELVRDLVDTILPATDSPAASEVGVDQTIDAIVANVYGKEDQLSYRKRFAELQEYLNNQKYRSQAAGEKEMILTELMKADKYEGARRSLLDLRQQTISCYLSSEEIGEKFLNYLPVPGAYEPCIDLASVGGKIWSI